MGALHVVKPGLLTTVQDLGRWGHQAEGVPVAGPMDVLSHRLANALVGNPPDAATLELTLLGPELIVQADTAIVVCGARFVLRVDDEVVETGVVRSARAGARLRIGRCDGGARGYLAVAGGGILTPAVLGSRATHLPSRMGGVDGRALVSGDVLPIAAQASCRAAHRSAPRTFDRPVTLRVLDGPQAAWFTDEAWQQLTTARYRLSPQSNRMGYRLEGPMLSRRVHDDVMSSPVDMGTMQVPAAGEPILLMADRQTAGGYARIAQVISADLDLAGQLGPGDEVRFARCTMREAAAALIAHERALLAQMPEEARAWQS
ncbi:MAG: biotin-dependent carboxyltransferase family protein [Acidobacteria bacterium]|nr:biotin-dependent carboxyltransferase family protein [Acidobacteriota bacterium]